MSEAVTARIVGYVLNSVTLIISIYLLFRVLNMSRKIHSVADFINSEVFTDKFNNLVLNFFADVKNTRKVLEPVAPLLRDLASGVPWPPLPPETAAPLDVGPLFLD